MSDWLVAATALMLVAVGCAGAPASTIPSSRNCLSSKGCPAARVLDACNSQARARALPLKKVLADADALVGQELEVMGPLRRGVGHCTLLSCYESDGSPGGCCNKCGAGLVISAVDKPGVEKKHAVLLINKGSGPHHHELHCVGDESLVCCPYGTGGQVVVTGKWMQAGESIYGKYYALENPRICRLAGKGK